MGLYQRLFFPWLRRLDAETAHEWTLSTLSAAGRVPGARSVLSRLAGRLPDRPVRAFGLTFPNVLGLAAGFDKEARVAAGMAALGFGHVEVGTLTPRPQAGNPRPRIFRLPRDRALINRMGFPNEGVAAALPRLRALRERSFILGVSLGKQKETPLADAVRDYETVMRAVYPYADYLAVNVSSPNTPGLRQLQGGNYLDGLLARLQTVNAELAAADRARPLLLKIAPDLSVPDLNDILDKALAHDIAGIIATNTTLARDHLRDDHQRESGGLSGAPLRARSTELIGHIHTYTAGRLPVIGVGGIFTAADMQAKLAAGAVLVQLYTSLIYEGPGLPGRLLRGLAAGA